MSIHFEGILREDRKVLIITAVFVFFGGVEGRMRELYDKYGLLWMLVAVNLLSSFVERYALLKLSGFLGDIMLIVEMRTMGHCHIVGWSDPRSNVILRQIVNSIFGLRRRMLGVELQVLLFGLVFEVLEKWFNGKDAIGVLSFHG